MCRYTMEKVEAGYSLSDHVMGESLFVPMLYAQEFENDVLDLSKLFDAEVVAAMLFEKYKPHGKYNYIRYD